MKRYLFAAVLFLLPTTAVADTFGGGLLSDGGALLLRWNRCVDRRRDPDVRIEACQRLIDDNATSIYRARRELAAAYVEQHDVPRALAAFAGALATGDNGALVLRAELYARTGSYDAAMADIGKYDTLGAAKPEVLNDRCWIRALAGQEMDAGLADCEESLRLRPNDADTLDTRGFILFRLGRMSAAMAAYEALLRLEPKMATAHYIRGMIESGGGDNAAGAADIAEALRLDAKIAQTYESYGVKPVP